uniref:Uncharacterized protein n=1 Tax=Klebsiella pneumoniae TaxID=573 RepID=A0A2P1BN99_KLEPN|nr:hypothetical protein [Klebsiella pneumoniae]
MVREREKRATLEPLHAIAKTLLPKLDVSQQNLLYYASPQTSTPSTTCAI